MEICRCVVIVCRCMVEGGPQQRSLERGLMVTVTVLSKALWGRLHYCLFLSVRELTQYRCTWHALYSKFVTWHAASLCTPISPTPGLFLRWEVWRAGVPIPGRLVPLCLLPGLLTATTPLLYYSPVVTVYWLVIILTSSYSLSPSLYHYCCCWSQYQNFNERTMRTTYFCTPVYTGHMTRTMNKTVWSTRTRSLRPPEPHL